MVLLFVRGAGRSSRRPPRSKEKRRRPKGSGSVYKLSGTRARPYVALTAKRDVLGTFETAGEAVQALDAYNAQNTPQRV